MSSGHVGVGGLFKMADVTKLIYSSHVGVWRLWTHMVFLNIGHKLLFKLGVPKRTVCAGSFTYCSKSKSNALKSNALVFSCNSVVFSSWEIVFSFTASCLRRISSFECWRCFFGMLARKCGSNRTSSFLPFTSSLISVNGVALMVEKDLFRLQALHRQ